MSNESPTIAELIASIEPAQNRAEQVVLDLLASTIRSYGDAPDRRQNLELWLRVNDIVTVVGWYRKFGALPA